MTLNRHACKVYLMTQRAAHGVQFTDCPECGTHIGVQGMVSHRKAHGVEFAPVRKVAKAKTPKMTAAEKRAASDARIAARVAAIQDGSAFQR